MEKDTERQIRTIDTEFMTREDGDNLILEGYFAVFDSNYEIAPGLSESFARGAFAGSVGGDIRALINHDTTLIIGRTAAHTLELHEDERGLWGRVSINPNDSDAINIYNRVKRGDVSGCSIGFMPIVEETEINDNGDVHWTIRDAELFEVSCCTFPAYEQTNISARSAEATEIRRRQMEAWKQKQKERLSKWH